jgi:hypothetical protein
MNELDPFEIFLIVFLTVLGFTGYLLYWVYTMGWYDNMVGLYGK